MVKKSLSPEIMSEVFAFSEPIYNFRSRKELKDIPYRPFLRRP